MADISKITTLDGTTYDLKDTMARSSIPSAATATPSMDGTAAVGSSTKYAKEDHVHPSDTSKLAYNTRLFSTNSFAPEALRSFYYSKIDNSFYAADKRFDISGQIGETSLTTTNISQMFDGSYEGGFSIPDGSSAVVTMDFSQLSGSKYPGYPYGFIFISFYSGRTPESITARVYNNYSSQGVGWKDLTCSKYDTNGYIWVMQNSFYGLQTLEITINAKSSSTYEETRPVEIEFYCTRPDPAITPVVSKYRSETLYYNLTAPKFIGALQGNADTATNASKVNSHTVATDVPSGAVFTDTKNTAGSTDSSSKLYLIGATSQDTNPQTYSQDTAYVGTDGCLYSGGTKVLTSHQDITGKLDKNLGSANSGKFLVVGSDGNIEAVTMTAWQGGSY